MKKVAASIISISLLLAISIGGCTAEAGKAIASEEIPSVTSQEASETAQSVTSQETSVETTVQTEGTCEVLIDMDSLKMDLPSFVEVIQAYGYIDDHELDIYDEKANLYFFTDENDIYFRSYFCDTSPYEYVNGTLIKEPYCYKGGLINSSAEEYFATYMSISGIEKISDIPSSVLMANFYGSNYDGSQAQVVKSVVEIDGEEYIFLFASAKRNNALSYKLMLVTSEYIFNVDYVSKQQEEVGRSELGGILSDLGLPDPRDYVNCSYDWINWL